MRQRWPGGEVGALSLGSVEESLNQSNVQGGLAFEGRTNNTALDRLALELQSCGLTLNEARVYLYLLANGAASVRAISKDTGLHRVEVYRKLHDLAEDGLIETQLDRPKRYSAVDPKAALSTLLRKQEMELASFKLRSRKMLGRLEKFARGNDARPQRGEPGVTYRLVRGRRKYYDEITHLAARAQNEILRILSPGGVIRTMLAGTLEEYKRAKARGVSMRMICEINPENRAYAQRLAGVVQLRHLQGVRLRFTIIDRSVTVIGARFDETSMSLDSTEDRYVVFEDPGFSEAFRAFFEYLWAQSKPVSPQRAMGSR
jgi:sugar-specific transcriptional regulator TrmB